MPARRELIEPLRKGEPYPGRRPPVTDQWRRLGRGARAAVVAIPLALVILLLALDLAAGVAAAVLVSGVGAATVTFVKNRTDRHNAAIDAGEILVPPDPKLRRVDPSTLDAGMIDKLALLGYTQEGMGPVKRFDGGWLVEKRRGRELAVVAGDDGGVAYYDPRWVPDVRAATEYIAGRGRD